MVLSAVAAVGCHPKRVAHSAPGAAEANVTSHCNDGYAVADGPYRYENNQWGRGKAQGPYEQCLLTREVGGTKERGWSWTFPGTDSSVFSYPEIIFGWKPWTGGKTTDPHLPTRVGEFKKLTVVYEVESQISGSYNLAPEVWITNRGVKNGAASPSSITAEVMFWMDCGGVAQPGGANVGTFVVAGEPFELWRQDGANGSGASSAQWRLLSFKRSKPLLKGQIDIPAFMRVLVEQQLIDPNHYISTVEFGNEVTGGSGTTWIKHFEVQTE
ncbi:MAG TPA: hypothetical protein VHB79_29785 [Polyangiaceae bacterium]|nr:hypothetical protein [Polyangiaceae bacterium]